MTVTPSIAKPSIAAPLLLATACLTIMVGCIVVPALSETAAALGVRYASWLVTLPSLGVIVGSPLAGWLIVHRGARATLAGGLFFYGLLGAMAPLLSGPTAVYADRLLLGGATAAVMASGTALIAICWQEPQARLRLIAAQGMAIELGGVVFLALGGWLAARDWRLPFLLYLLAWVLPVLLAGVRPMPAAKRAGDGSRPAWPLGVLATATAAMAVFFVGVLNLPASLATIGLASRGTGLFLAFVSLVAVVAASRLPALVRRLGESGTFVAAFACEALAFLVFAASPPLPTRCVGALLLGVGFGWSVPLANHAVVSRSTPATLGPLLAALSFALFLGQFLASFAEWIPGPANAPFFAAAALAAVSAATRLPGLRAARAVRPSLERK